MTHRFFPRSKRLAIGLVVVGSATLLAACGNATPTATEPPQAEDAPMATEAPELDYAAPGANTIVDIAASEAEFSTLVQAIEAADLTETLASSTPITVFAPTNDAFEALPEGALEALLQPERRSPPNPDGPDIMMTGPGGILQQRAEHP